MHVDDEGEMSPKIKSVDYLAVGAGTVFDPPTNDLILYIHTERMQNMFLCVSGECTMNPRMLRSTDSSRWWSFLVNDVNSTKKKKLLIVFALDGRILYPFAPLVGRRSQVPDARQRSC